jgi:hypothetical protein
LGADHPAAIELGFPAFRSDRRLDI